MRDISRRDRIIRELLGYLHDTELWASYLPRIPRALALFALVGFCLIIFAIWLRLDGQAVFAWIGLGLGELFILPMFLTGLFARWRWRRRSSLRREILDTIQWRGDEKVLDVGCGSGLLLNGMAMRLKTGKAIGIDLWVAHTGAGNYDLLWKNARSERVADRIEFREADARKIPFDAETFDVVASSGSLHHIGREYVDFERTIREMMRVTKPGGQIVIWDLVNLVNACATMMNFAGVKCEVRETGRFLTYNMGMVVGRKGA